MDEKIMNSIKGGVIAGVVMAVIYTIQIVSGKIPGVNVIACLLGPLFGLLILLGMIAAGILALYFGPKILKTLMDAIMASAISGAIAGAILAVVLILLEVVLNGNFLSVITGVVYLVASTIVAVIAGALYAIVMLKITK